MATDFKPPFWLSNSHAQTVFGRIVRPRQLVALRRETLVTPDGDELVLDHLDTHPAANHIVLMHGLEGSSYSVYMQGVMSLAARRGFSATAINFRSCARDPQQLSRMISNRRPRFYHSGETGDFDFVVRTLASRMPDSTLFGFGASLGGNVLLKWLGEHPRQQLVRAAAVVSVPFDLGAGARCLDANPIGRLYVGHFLLTLRHKVATLAERFPEVHETLDLGRALAARTFRDFDDTATAPLHGFAGADDYYTRCSSIHYLSRITTPVLAIAAGDDPFIPPGVLPCVREVAPSSLQLVATARGGHVGFVTGSSPWNCSFWAEEMLVAWLAERAAENPGASTAAPDEVHGLTPRVA